MYLMAAIAFQLVDALAVAIVLSLLERAPVKQIWRNCHLWSFPYVPAAGGFAAVWAQAQTPASLSAVVTCAMMLYPMSTFYQEVVTRTSRLSQRHRRIRSILLPCSSAVAVCRGADEVCRPNPEPNSATIATPPPRNWRHSHPH
jgi:hypothetical protein